MSLGSVICVYFETKLRLAIWSQLYGSPNKANDNAIICSEWSMKYMWFIKFSLPLVNWYVYTVV